MSNVRLKFPDVGQNNSFWYSYGTTKFVQELISIMRLTAWDITVDLTHVFSDDYDNKTASVVSNPVYMNATIKLYKKFYELEFKDQLSTLVHELFHVIVSPTAYAQQCSAYPEALRIRIFEDHNARAYDDAEETVVQNLTRMFVPTLMLLNTNVANHGRLTIEIRPKLGATTEEKDEEDA